MLRSRLGLKVLGLWAVGLGAMAIGAGGAGAETNSRWNVAGKSVTGTESFQTEIKEIENNTGQLLFTTKSGTKVAILCTTMKFTAVSGRLIKEGSISLGRVLFDLCLTKLNGVTSAACKPRSWGALSGSILTEAFNGLIILDEVNGVKQDYVKITPENSASLTSKLFTKIELGAECAIGEFVNVEAKSLGEGLWIKDCKGNTSFTSEAETHLIEESLNGLIALGQPATIDGSAIVWLTGGVLWSGTPG
jgi:hypothetical protein